MLLLDGADVNPPGRSLGHTVNWGEGGMAAKSPALDRRLLAGRAGLWEAAGPHLKDTARCHPIGGARLSRMS